MTRLPFTVAATAAALTFTGCTTTTAAWPEGDGRQCFFTSSVSGFRNAPRSETGSEQIYVDVGVGDTYLFEVFGACPDLDFSNQIALVSRTGTSNICRGTDVDLLVPRSGIGGADRCPVRIVRKLASEERAATKR